MSCFSSTLLESDQHIISRYSRLGAGDSFSFLGEYERNNQLPHTETKKIIRKLKKFDSRGRQRCNIDAVAHSALALHRVFEVHNLEDVTFVPVPPSKMRDDPLYDDRLMLVLQVFNELRREDSNRPIDIREIVSQSESTKSAHSSFDARDPAQLAELYQVDTVQLAGCRKKLFVFDDVITTGTHFRAMKCVLQRDRKDVEITGLFLARGVYTSGRTGLKY